MPCQLQKTPISSQSFVKAALHTTPGCWYSALLDTGVVSARYRTRAWALRSEIGRHGKSPAEPDQ